MNLSNYGEDGIRILFGDVIDLEVHEKVRRFYYLIKSLKRQDIIDIIPSFRSCLIHFDLRQTTYERLSSLIMDAHQQAPSVRPLPEAATHEIPVHYGGEYGFDMAFVCTHTGLPEDEIIDIHAGVVYTVFAIGFVPGFPTWAHWIRGSMYPGWRHPAPGFREDPWGLHRGRRASIPFHRLPAGALSEGRIRVCLIRKRNPTVSCRSATG